MNKPHSKTHHTQWEIILGLLIVFLSIAEFVVIHQIKTANSNRTKYYSMALQTLVNANFERNTIHNNIVQDYINYDSYRINQKKPRISKYYQAHFSDELKAAIARSEKKPFDDIYYAEMLENTKKMSASANEWISIAEQSYQDGAILQRTLLIFSIISILAAWVASKLEGKNRMSLFKLIKFPFTEQ